jgi:outer membrane protein
MRAINFLFYFSIGCSLMLVSNSLAGQNILTLSECVERAINRNLALKNGLIDVELSRQNELQSKLNLLPSLNGVATHGYNWGQRIDPFTNQFATSRVQSNNFGVSANMDVFNGFQNQNQIKAAKYQRQASEDNLQKVKDNIGLQVANAFLETVSSIELLKVAEIQLEITEEQVSRTRALVTAGSLPKVNLLDLEAQLAQEAANLIAAQNTKDFAMLQLAQLIMLTPDEFENFEVRAPDIEQIEVKTLQYNSKDVYRSALRNMPVINEAENLIEAGLYRLKASKASRYPSISFQGFIGTGFSGLASEATGEPQFLGFQPVGIVQATGQEVVAPIFVPERSTIPFSRQTNTNFNQAVTFSLNIPIFNKGQINNQIKRSELDFERSRLNLEQEKLQLRQDVEQAWQSALAAYNQYKAEKSAFNAANESFEFIQNRFKQQSANVLEFNQAKTRLAQSESNLIRAKYQYVFRVKVLEFYQGTSLNL